MSKPRPKAQPFNILINASSGTASAKGEQAIKDAISKSGLKIQTFNFLEMPLFKSKLKELKDSDIPLLIGGGDGTVNMAASFYKDSDKAFGILPFGTMNMLAHDVNVPTELEKMFEAYNTYDFQKIDMATLNDKAFLCAAALGVMPDASVFREENRNTPDIVAMPKLGWFVFEAFEPENHRRVQVNIDDKNIYTKAAAFVCSNNLYAFPEETKSPKDSFKKHSLNGGILGLYMASPQNFWEKLSFLISLRSGRWKNNPVLKKYSGQKICLKTKNKEELISLDGEPMHMKTPLKFEVHKKALTLIVPSNQHE